MAIKTIDAVGLKCPQPVLKLTANAPEMDAGDILEIVADCPTFEKDVRQWCERLNKEVLFVKNEGNGRKKIQIQF